MEPEEDQEAPPLPFLPAELLPSIFRAQDLSHAAQVCHSWKRAVYEGPEGFQQCFQRDFGAAAAAEYAARKTWRDKYIAHSIDGVCRSLREKAVDLDDLEDTSAALERSVQSSMMQLSHLDRTVNHRRWDLNQLLTDVAGRASAHAGSALGKEILAAAQEMAAAKKGGAQPGAEQQQRQQQQGRDKGEREAAGEQRGESSTAGRRGEAAAVRWLAQQGGWRGRLTAEVAAALAEAAKDVQFWEDSLKEHKEALKTLMESLKYVGDSIRAVRDGVQELRRRRAALEAATTYRHTMRRA